MAVLFMYPTFQHFKSMSHNVLYGCLVHVSNCSIFSVLNDYLRNVQREVDKKLHAVSIIPRGKHVRDDEQVTQMLVYSNNLNFMESLVIMR